MRNSLTQMRNIESLLEDDALFEEILRRTYQTQVVFTNFLQEFSSEFARALGRNDPFLDQKIRSTLLTFPLREKFFAKLAEVAQS